MSTPDRRAVVCLLALAAGAAAAQAAQLADPTRPSATAAPAEREGGMHVEAIIVRATSRVAIVDGHLVRAGDRIGDVVIEAVTPEGVRYSRGGHSAFARLSAVTVTVRHTPVPGG
jgi:ribosomal protein L14